MAGCTSSWYRLAVLASPARPGYPDGRARPTRARYTQPLSTPSAHHAPAAGGRVADSAACCGHSRSAQAGKRIKDTHPGPGDATPYSQWAGRLSFSQLLPARLARSVPAGHSCTQNPSCRASSRGSSRCPAHVPQARHRQRRSPQRLHCCQPSVQRQSLCARGIRTKVAILPDMGPPVCGRSTSPRRVHATTSSATGPQPSRVDS